jgi:hypothetical protein
LNFELERAEASDYGSSTETKTIKRKKKSAAVTGYFKGNKDRQVPILRSGETAASGVSGMWEVWKKQKFEILNPKYETNSNDKNSNDRNNKCLEF